MSGVLNVKIDDNFPGVGQIGDGLSIFTTGII